MDEIEQAIAELRSAVTQYDVGATVQDEDVELWNAVTSATSKLDAAIKSVLAKENS